MNKVLMTLRGLADIEFERNRLKNEERQKVIKAIADARDLGDLSENAEYHAAREQQAWIEGKIKELDDIISRVQSIDPKKIKEDNIVFGATVLLHDLDSNEDKQYQIVGEPEANIDMGTISYISPLGKLLIGKAVGDIVELNTSKSNKTFEIINIKYI